MYKLTERRLILAQKILEDYRAELTRNKRFSAGLLERALKDVWVIGYQSIKEIMIDVLKNHERYGFVAAYYMEHINAPVVVLEFKRPLAKAYGISHYDSDERKNARESFWRNAYLELTKSDA